MSHNILLTGVSGYLGGSLLARWTDADLPAYSHLYALIRNSQQAEAVKQYGAEPLLNDLSDHESLSQSIIERSISVIFFCIDAASTKHQPTLIKALAEVKNRTGREVHFLHTSGAKLFSRHVGISTDRVLLDTDPDLYELAKNATGPHEGFNEAAKVNPFVIDTAEANGVRSYIFAPCIVYGRGDGFGNKTSIQDAAIVKYARKLRKVYAVDSDNPSWPVCHIEDNTALYLQIMRKILSGERPDSGKEGFYLASSGSIPWMDIYRSMARALFKRGVIDTDEVGVADENTMAKIAEALECPPSLVPVQVGGKCTYEAERGAKLGWTPRYSKEHFVENADDEVEFILDQIK